MEGMAMQWSKLHITNIVHAKNVYDIVTDYNCGKNYL